MTSISDQFINRYVKELDFYQEAARLCAQECEVELGRSGIRAMVTFRAKRVDKLREKVAARNKAKTYTTVDQIYADIIDLAGVRIALYFPGDVDEVDKMINSRFEILRTKEFPKDSQADKRPGDYNKRFPGYAARHYHIRMNEGQLAESQKRYAQAVIEIQVASVLMHAWAEVEHDLIYKPESGELSEDEYAILDGLNGLVLSGEVYLERLQRAGKRRIAEADKHFNSRYELAAYLYDRYRQTEGPSSEPPLGRIDILYRFLQLIHRDSPREIEQYLNELEPDSNGDPISDRIVELITAPDPDLLKTYFQALQDARSDDPYSAPDESQAASRRERELGVFLTNWITLERALKGILDRSPDAAKTGPPTSLSRLRSLNWITPIVRSELDALRKVRSEVVHVGTSVDTTSIALTSLRMRALLSELHDIAPADLKPLLQRAVQDIKVTVVGRPKEKDGGQAAADG